MQQLENILPAEVEALVAALSTARMIINAKIEPAQTDAIGMIDYALRIIEHRRRGQAANDQRFLESFAADCKKYGSD